MFKRSQRHCHPLIRATGLIAQKRSTTLYHNLLRRPRAVVTTSPQPLRWRNLAATFARHQSTGAADALGEDEAGSQRAKEPAYEITFTCRPCQERSAHRISKQGYHRGSVLITCPGCKARHIISDHLNMFGDTTTDIETILKEKGEMVKRGTLGEGGDVEFWDDGSSTPREMIPEERVKNQSLE